MILKNILVFNRKKKISFLLLYIISFLMILIPSFSYIQRKSHTDLIIPTVETKTINSITFPEIINSDHNYILGEEDTFTVFDFETKNAISVSATCKYISKEAFFFVDNEISPDFNLTQIADIVDNNMIPILTTNFGEISDIDNNERCVILFTIIPGVGGYFDPFDFSKYGYNGEIVYINVNSILFQNRIDIIIHELQHLVHYNHDSKETVWFNEGCSMFSQFYLGYSLGETDKYTLYYPNQISLLYWDYDNAGPTTDYLAVLTFISYVQDQYGSENLTAIYNAQSDGVKLQGKAAIMKILDKIDPNLSFEQLYMNWIIASIVDVFYSEDNRAYYYQNFDCYPDSIKYPQSYLAESYQYNRTWSIYPWATKVYNFGKYPNPNEINVSIDIPPTSQDHLFGINIIKEIKKNESINYEIKSFMLTPENISDGFHLTLNATEDNFEYFYITISHLDGGEGYYRDMPNSEKNVMVSLEVISKLDTRDESITTTTTKKRVTANIPLVLVFIAGMGLKILIKVHNRSEKN